VIGSPPKGAGGVDGVLDLIFELTPAKLLERKVMKGGVLLPER
jgi:hypothetical protein